MLTPTIVEEYYHLSFKVKEKIARNLSDRGKGFVRGIGKQSGREKGKPTAQK